MFNIFKKIKYKNEIKKLKKEYEKEISKISIIIVRNILTLLSREDSQLRIENNDYGYITVENMNLKSNHIDEFNISKDRIIFNYTSYPIKEEEYLMLKKRYSNIKLKT